MLMQLKPGSWMSHAESLSGQRRLHLSRSAPQIEHKNSSKWRALGAQITQHAHRSPVASPCTNQASRKMQTLSSFLLSLQQTQSYITMKLSASRNQAAFRILRENLQHLHVYLSMKTSSFVKHASGLVKHAYWFMAFHSNPLILQLTYFIAVSFAGFLALRGLRPRREPAGPRDLDLFFTSVSTATVSSMSTVEMEDLSDPQLWVLILLMLLGGEVFTSMLGLHFQKARAKREDSIRRSTGTDIEMSNAANFDDHKAFQCSQSELPISEQPVKQRENLNQSSATILAYVVAGYIVATVALSSAVLMIYLWTESEAHDLLKGRGIKVSTFAIFAAASSFANCGFMPVNDMAMFRKKSSLLFLIIPQTLVGNALFPPSLRLCLWFLEKISKREEYDYILRQPEKSGYKHLYSQKQSVYITLTVIGLILLQMMFLCTFEWDSEVLNGLDWFQKLVCSLFQSVNTRHAGESVIDMSKLSPAILVLFALMMYLPSNISFLPLSDDQPPLPDEKEISNRKAIWKYLVLPKPASLVVFVILVCITERKSMSQDPANFNIFSIVFEVISAYGNVGYSLGYSCSKLPEPHINCKDAAYGFVGRWSNEGRLIMIMVMFMGRLKRFSLKGAQAWKFL